MAYNAVYEAELVIADEILLENVKWFENLIYISQYKINKLKGYLQNSIYPSPNL